MGALGLKKSSCFIFQKSSSQSLAKEERGEPNKGLKVIYISNKVLFVCMYRKNVAVDHTRKTNQ